MKHLLHRFLAFALMLTILLSAAAFPVAAESRFTDVDQGSWYAEAVEYVSSRGLMNGVASDRFAPNETLNRAMFVTILARFDGAELDNSSTEFGDVPTGKWYTGAVSWAYEAGIVNGVSRTEFAPMAYISRQDLCTILARYINSLDLTVPEEEPLTFADASSIARYARDAVDLCSRLGLVAGFDDGTFHPKGIATRAQTAMIFMRLDQVLQGLKPDPTPMPAQSFDGSAGEDMSISVNAPEGALPENTDMTVTRVNDLDTLLAIQEKVDGVIYAAADISFEKDGAEIEPAVAVEVQITVEGMADMINPVVYHVTNDGEVEPVNGVELITLHRGGDPEAVRFQAKDFSVYVVVDKPIVIPEARVEVNFWKYPEKIEANHRATYYVKNSDVLLGEGTPEPGKSYIETICPDPGIGDIDEGYLFRGWTTDPNFGPETEPLTINKIWQDLADMDIKEGDKIDYYAMIFRFYNVSYFGEQKDNTTGELISLGTDVVLFLDGQTTNNVAKYVVNMPYKPLQGNQNFEGWVARVEEGENGINYENRITAYQYAGETSPTTGHPEDGVYPNTTTIYINGDVVFDVLAPEGFWLIFETNGKGGTYAAPQFIRGDLEESITKRPAVTMKRAGYSFDDWYVADKENGYTDADLDKDPTTGNVIINSKLKKFTFGGKLTENTTVYGNWIMNTTANYTVVFWTQNADRTAYDLAGSVMKSGTVGSTIQYSVVENGDEHYVADFGNDVGHYTGFYLTDASRGQQVEIHAEGNSILNLYYDRIVYELRFYLARNNNGTWQCAHYPNNGGTNVWGMVNGWNNAHPTIAAAYQSRYPVQTASGNNAPNGFTSEYISISAYYGQDISTLWPPYAAFPSFTLNNNTFNAVSFILMQGAKLRPSNIETQSGKGTVKGVITRLDEMILGATNDADGNFLICRFDSTSYDWTYHMYYEALPGVTYTVDTIDLTDNEGNTVTYYWDHDVASRSSNRDGAQQNPPQYYGYESVMQADGVTTYYDNVTGTNTNNPSLNYYYNRKVYPITFLDGVYVDGDGHVLESRPAQVLKVSDPIQMGDTVAQFANPGDRGKTVVYEEFQNGKYAIECPLEGYVFEGWFVDNACKQEYTFTTMPVEGIQVHAKWRQIEYRVFLHSGFETGDLSWGSESQKMTFRIAYGDKVSLPSGTYPGFHFVCWDDENGDFFDADVVKLIESVVTGEYDKTEDMTDVMNKYGQIVPVNGTLDNGSTNTTAPYNSDLTGWDDDPNDDIPAADRYWVTKKLDLYADWSQIMEGADGIGVEYVVGQYSNTVIDDSYLYREGAQAIGEGAPEILQEYQDDVVFLYWVVQKWVPELDGSGQPIVDIDANGVETPRGDYEDTDVHAFPGDGFRVIGNDAKRIVKARDDQGKITKATYTIRLRAAYLEVDPELPTHIDWVANGGNFVAAEGAKADPEESNEHYNTDYTVFYQEHLHINDAVKIPAPPEKAGYAFLGWAAIRATNDVVTNAPEGSDPDAEYEGTNPDYKNPYTRDGVELSEGVLKTNLGEYFIPYNRYEGYYYYNVNGENQVVTEVAADEAHPYHVMYAIWGRANFFVFHSSTGTLQAFEVPIKASTTQTGKQEVMPFDLTALVPDGYLYGGYYSSYGGVNTDTVTAAARAYPGGDFTWGSASLVSANWNELAEITASSLNASFVKYDGTSKKNGTTPFWTKAYAYNADANGVVAADVNGETMKPQNDAIYYLKEVPEVYLQSRYAYVYSTKQAGSDEVVSLDNLFLLTVVDDGNYKGVSFRTGASLAAAAGQSSWTTNAVLTPRFTIVQVESQHSGTDPTIDTYTPQDLIGGGQKGYIAVQGFDDLLNAEAFTMLPSWQTFDGVVVGNNPMNLTVGDTEITISEEQPAEPEKANMLYIDTRGCSTIANWEDGGADTWLYMYGNGNNTFVQMEHITGTTIYQVEIPDGMTDFIILRCRPGRYGWGYDNLYNRGGSIHISDTGNCLVAFGMTGYVNDEWDDNGYVQWKTYMP